MLIISDNNHHFDFDLNLPLKMAADGTVATDHPRPRIFTPSIHEDHVLCPTLGGLVCLELDSMHTKWTLPGCGARMKLANGLLITTVDERLACLDPTTAEIAWQVDDREELMDVFGQFVFSNPAVMPYPLRCRNLSTGAVVWDSTIGGAEQLFFTANLFVVWGETCVAADMETGEILWSFDRREWIERNILSMDLDFPDSFSEFQRYRVRLGPLINNTLHVMPAVGPIAAIDVATGELKGTTTIPTGPKEKDHVSPEIQSLIYRNGRLFFHRTGFRQEPSIIFGALDAASGELLYVEEHVDTAMAAEIGPSIMVRDYYLLVVQASFLFVFDTRQREMAGTYSTDNKDRYSLCNGPVPIDNGLIFSDQKQRVFRLQGRG